MKRRRMPNAVLTNTLKIVNTMQQYGIPVTGFLTNKVMADFLQQQRHHISKQCWANFITSIQAFTATNPILLSENG